MKLPGIEFMGLEGLIRATGPNAEATLQFKGIDRRMTRVRGEIFCKRGDEGYHIRRRAFRAYQRSAEQQQRAIVEGYDGEK